MNIPDGIGSFPPKQIKDFAPAFQRTARKTNPALGKTIHALSIFPSAILGETSASSALKAGCAFSGEGQDDEPLAEGGNLTYSHSGNCSVPSAARKADW